MFVVFCGVDRVFRSLGAISAGKGGLTLLTGDVRSIGFRIALALALTHMLAWRAVLSIGILSLCS